jgi:MFS family permease
MRVGEVPDPVPRYGPGSPLTGIGGSGRPPALAADAARVRQARNAVSVAFIGAGFAFASWASRIPQVRAELRVTPGVLGLILLGIAAGAAVAIPLSGVVITRLGEARTLAAMSLVAAAGLATVAAGYTHGIAPTAAGLSLFGFGSGGWDVAMNVQGAAVERAIGRAIMPRFHAGWSIGTVAGAAAGTVMVALHVPVAAHLLAVALAVAVAALAATGRFLPSAAGPPAADRSAAGRSAAGRPAADRSAAGRPASDRPASDRPASDRPASDRPASDRPARDVPAEAAPRRNPLAAWTEPRTLVIGLFVLCMSVIEGAGNDWLSLGVIDGYHTAAAAGTATFAVFLAAMTAGRWFGPGLIDAYGRIRTLRGCTATALAGLLVVVFAGFLPLAMAGAALMGLGTSLGFPVGLSAAADEPGFAAGRVATASSIGYAAFLAGPPAIGFLADHVGVLNALSAAGVLLAAAFFFCRATAPIGERTSRAGSGG